MRRARVDEVLEILRRALTVYTTLQQLYPCCNAAVN